MYENVMIHETAVVDEGARIGRGTKIWHFSHVMATAEIGEECVIGQGCNIAGHIGQGCHIQNNVSVFGGVRLENFVFVGPSAVFTNVRRPRSWIKQAPVSWIHMDPRIHVRQRATIGGGAVIVPDVLVGEYAFVAAGAVVTKDVEPYTLVAGNPARFVEKIDYKGQRDYCQVLESAPKKKKRFWLFR